VPFSLEACTVDPLEKRWETSYLEDLCTSLGIPWHHERHDIFAIIQNREERSPCSFCANMRRGILNSIAQKKGCNILALGHHQDDAIETVFLNLFSGGRFRCFSPKLYQSNSKITLIRPLVYIREERILQETQRLGLLPVPFECPHAETSHRERARTLVKRLEQEIPSLRTNIIHALLHGEPQDIWSPFLEKKVAKRLSRRNDVTGEAPKR
jgi:tRNA(Ile)-lysidine synthase TilS/MesJ